jgi:hypothetical protein
MLQTYFGTLRGGQIEWDPAGSPPAIGKDDAVRVQVIVLEQRDSDAAEGRAMASALERLAASSTDDAIDAAEWQRRERTDRKLPGRGN